MIYAHTPPRGSTRWNPLFTHLTQVAEYAQHFATPFGAGDMGFLVGLLHDVGKSSQEFQDYLQWHYQHRDTEHARYGTTVDHKTRGAIMASEVSKPLATVIFGHHGGLPLLLSNKDIQNKRISVERTQLHPAMQQFLDGHQRTPKYKYPTYVTKRNIEFFLRMLYSALVDADALATEWHFSNWKTLLRTMPDVSLDTLSERFEANQQQLRSSSSPIVHEARQAMYHDCVAAAEQNPGIFRLAIPTGGGKTRSAMAFALHHSQQYHKERIIVAVPYISITEQTAQEYRRIFETDDTDVVLEHHSSSAAMINDENDHVTWSRLAAENWDARIVVTTMVQLFESLFANKPSRCRKLHNLVNSVIILDEVQSLPYGLLTPILAVIKELTTNYGVTVVLSTATQPAFETLPVLADIRMIDMVRNAEHWFEVLRRVNYDFRDNRMDWTEIANEMRRHNQVLTIVNTKNDAITLIQELDDDTALHLSTYLCGAHRRAVINEIHRRLTAGEPCRVVSTQVIEAGVDVDFPVVYRAIAPLDSIIQAAGRCNRNGNRDRGLVVVFTPKDEKVPRGYYALATGTTKSFLSQGTIDLNTSDVMNRYTRWLLGAYGEQGLDEKCIQKLRQSCNYPEVAEAFRMIEEPSVQVIVTTFQNVYVRDDQVASEEQIMEWVRLLYDNEERSHHCIRIAVIMRRLQPYMVSLPMYAFRKVQAQTEVIPGYDALFIWHGDYDNLVNGLIYQEESNDRPVFA
jgi:CRISPR-associated endonuclease/helicase Cas3